jgi:hypothetical protein
LSVYRALDPGSAEREASDQVKLIDDDLRQIAAAVDRYRRLARAARRVR